jgi:hypothetical protein
VLAFGLASVISANRMIRLRQDYGGTGNTGTHCGELDFDIGIGYWLPFSERICDESRRRQTPQTIDLQSRDDC